MNRQDCFHLTIESVYDLLTMVIALGLLILPSALVSASGQEPNASTVSSVTVGAYVNDIQSVDLREHSYAVDIYIWFRWKDTDLAPHESMEVVNPYELWGHVRTTVYEQPLPLPDGDLYQVVRIQGKFTRKFFFYNYPFDRQQLTIELEDAEHETNRLVYVADEKPLVIDPEMKLPGYFISPAVSEYKTVLYPTAFGDTRRSQPNSYSRVSFTIPIRRPIFASCIKMLLPIVCVVIGASIMLRLPVSYVDARIGVGITALLTVVAIQLAANDNMPTVDYLVLMDKIDLCAYGYVLAGLSIVLTTIRKEKKDGPESAQRVQRIGYLVINLVFTALIAFFVALAIWQG